MITITINNSYSQITGLTPKLEKELKELLSYTVGGSGAYFSAFGPKRRSLLDKKGNFPTGLLHRVAKGASDFKAKFVYLGSADKINFDPPSEGLYKWQSEAVEIALKACRGIISATTGSGKSLVIKELILRHGLKTLVVVPTLEIRKQLEEVLKGIPKVNVRNIDSKDLKTLIDFDLLIIDETHHVAAKTYRDLNKTAWNKIGRRFFLTATPFRNDNEEQLLFESIAGEVIYQLTYKEAVKNKYIVPVDAYYIEIPKQSTDAYTYRQVYNELVVNNVQRNEQISNLLKSLQQNAVYTLCLVREVAHGKILSDLTGIPFVSGVDDDSRDYIRQFKSGRIKMLIGTEGILSEGVDTKPCEYVVVAGLGKAKSNFMQKIGRTVRNYLSKESGKVIIFRDSSHKFLLRHFNAQRKILLEEYGVKPVKLEL